MKELKHFDFLESPVEFFPRISELFKIKLYIKRDDLFPGLYGGNKARKSQYILYDALQKGCNAIVTAGDLNSNHSRATALMASKLGMRIKIIVHNDHPENEYLSQNMYLCRMVGAEIIYCSKSDVAKTMDKAMSDFEADGCRPYYIWGGGHCLQGSYAYYEAVRNLTKQINFSPDYIFFASGTGTTHAGLHVGAKYFYPQAKVIGVSIARMKERGVNEIFKSVNELESYLELPYSDRSDIIFKDDYIADGYESSSKNEEDLIRDMALKEGLILDPTYSGKAFFGMREMVLNNREMEGKNVLFWNTGGIFNLLSNKI